MVTKAQIKATSKYESKTYDKILLRIRKEDTPSRSDIQSAAAAARESVNEYILNAIRDRMKRE